MLVNLTNNPFSSILSSSIFSNFCDKLKHKSKEEFQISKLTIKFGLVTRIAPIGTSYNGKEYIDMALLNFAIYYPITYLELLAETRWAAFGDYGAYAEGLIGLSIPLIKYKNISISWIFSISI